LKEIYERKLALGVRMIETGASYGTEAAFEQGVRASGVAREDVYVISKVKHTPLSLKEN
jgi:diketogulonate reductase-like aldo/keto reductase